MDWNGTLYIANPIVAKFPRMKMILCSKRDPVVRSSSSGLKVAPTENKAWTIMVDQEEDVDSPWQVSTTAWQPS